jgi:phosphatidyl-myo-inositol dimannoside synthase
VPRYLLISNVLPPTIGGSGVVYDQLAKALAPDILVIGTKDLLNGAKTHEQNTHSDANKPYRIKRLWRLRPPDWEDFRRKLSPLDRLLIDPVVLLYIFLRLAGLCWINRIKVLIIGDLIALGWLAIAFKWLPVRPKILLYIHGEEVTTKPASLYGRLRARALNAADYNISISDFAKLEMVARYQVPPEKIIVNPNGVHFADFSEIRTARKEKPLPTPEGQIRLLSVGRLVKRKGFINLIEAMPLILAHFPNAVLDIVGHGPLAPTLATLVSQHQLEAHIRLHGALESAALRQLYTKSDVFLQPGITLEDGDVEGFGLVFLEANACGIPVVGGLCGGMPEAIVAGKTGLLVDGNDVNAIAGATIDILTNTSCYTNMQQEAMAWAQACDWSTRLASFKDFAASL